MTPEKLIAKAREGKIPLPVYVRVTVRCNESDPDPVFIEGTVSNAFTLNRTLQLDNHTPLGFETIADVRVVTSQLLLDGIVRGFIQKLFAQGWFA